MTDDHDWVARLLAESAPPGIPDDVAMRLDRALRDATGQARPDGTGTPDTGTDLPGADVPGADVPAAASPDHAATTTAPGTGVSVAPVVSGASAASVNAAGPPVVGAVPPPASTATTGALPRLRGLPTRASVSSDGASGQRRTRGVDASTTVPGRRPGSSRREQRQDDQVERRRRLLTRWAPVAAGVLVLGGAAVAATNLVGGGESATLAESSSDAAAGAAAESAVAPRALVATGTQYSTTDVPAFEEQVRGLVAVVSAGDLGAAGGSAGAADAPQDEATALQAPAEASAGADAARAADTSPLADPQALADCVGAVTDGATTTAVAVDLAVVDGVDSIVLVVPDAAGLIYQVYVVGAGCGDLDTRFLFFLVAP